MFTSPIGHLLIFIGIMGVLILAHEAGHLILALRCDVPVTELGLGLPPRLLKIGSFKGMLITLNWIPLGGFVLLDGELDPTRPRGLAARPPISRLAILSAGSITNLILG